MNRGEFLRFIGEQTGVRPVRVRFGGNHELWRVAGHRFTISYAAAKIDRPKAEAVCREIGIRSPWH